MPTVVYPDTIRAVAHLAFGAEEATNTWHFRLQGGGSFPAAAGIINTALGVFYASGGTAPNRGVGGRRAPASTLDRITLTDLRTVPNPVPLVFAHTVPGTGTGTVLPLSVAAVASLRTAIAGRSGRGRIFIPHLMTTALATSSAQFDGTSTSLFADSVQDLATRLNTGDPNLSIAVLSVVQAVSRDVISVVVNSLPDTQRRRDEDLAPATVVQLSITP